MGLAGTGGAASSGTTSGMRFGVGVWTEFRLAPVCLDAWDNLFVDWSKPVDAYSTWSLVFSKF